MEQAALPGTASLETTLVVKRRNGQHVPFFDLRIARAIESAWKAHRGIPQEAGLPERDALDAAAVTERVVAWCRAQADTRPVLFIEAIQDAVVAQLRAAGHADIAGRYAAYRQEQERQRFETLRVTVEKRDGRVVSFKPEKIALAIGKAFAAESPGEPLPRVTRQRILELADEVVALVKDATPGLRTVHIETIQDVVEQTLAARGHQAVAERYRAYRRARHDARRYPPAAIEEPPARAIIVSFPDGRREPLDRPGLRRLIAELCRGLDDQVNAEALFAHALASCTDVIPAEQVEEAVLLAARTFIEREPAYSLVAARVLLRRLYREVEGRAVTFEEMRAAAARTFEHAIHLAIECRRLDPALARFDLPRLGAALRPERDLQFQYMGLQTLYDRYLIHVDGRRVETPQSFWMRIAMGLAMSEPEAQREERAMEFYEVLSTFRFIASTPTLFNAGTCHPQLSSCFLTTIRDDLDHIFSCIKDNALLSKWSGGLGNDWTPVRALGARIHGTNGKSQGVIPFMKVANDTAIAVNQGGKRQGAVCAYLEVWHLDIEEFLELRKNTGDDRRRTHDMHTANWIPDVFMKRVLADGPWTLFSPHETPDLHDLYGLAFERRYEAYEALAQAGGLKAFKVVPAIQLWRKMLSLLFETGHPWITFKDPSNIRSPQDHAGVVHSSNLCTEILLNTSREETAVCNLGSINLAEHTTPAGLDGQRLARTVRTAIRMLDNVIDANYYPTPQARASNLRHRPVGLGLMGFQDALYAQGFSYASPQAVAFADESMELIAYHAILASSELARERGTYASYSGSKWDRGLLPIDTIEPLERERGAPVRMDRTVRLDWTPVRESIRRHGMRNSNTMAIAPTATIANIVGVTASIEPTYKNLYVKSNLSGEFTIINPWLVEELSALELWDDAMLQDLKYFDGSVQEIARVPQAVKDRFATAFEIGPEWLIQAASRRQKWIDMGQSLNLYLAEPSGKKLHAMYLLAWECGLKTTYYLRSLGATRVEPSTLDVNRYDNPIGRSAKTSAPACALDGQETCESCQ